MIFCLVVAKTRGRGRGRSDFFFPNTFCSKFCCYSHVLIFYGHECCFKSSQNSASAICRAFKTSRVATTQEVHEQVNTLFLFIIYSTNLLNCTLLSTYAFAIDHSKKRYFVEYIITVIKVLSLNRCFPVLMLV